MTLTFPEARATPATDAAIDAGPGPTVSSRLLAVLGCFDLNRQLLTLTEIADATGLPLSTARRLIVELVKWGALERIADGRYRVGTRLWRVGNLAAVQRELREAAAPFLQELSTVSAGTAQLAVLDGLDALCIDKVCGPGAGPTATHVGGRLPLHATAVGKVLLAGSPPTLLADLARRGLERRTPRTLVEPGRLAASVHRARTSGVGTSQEEMTIGAASVAAAVPGRDGSTAAAIGLVVHAHRPLPPLVRAVTAAAQQVARRLQDGGFAATPV